MRVKWRRLFTNVILLISGYWLGWACVRYKPFGSAPCAQSRRDSELAIGTTGLDVSDSSLMIGIMSSRKNLPTRASAIYSTWGQDFPGLIVFYVGGDDHAEPTLEHNFTSLAFKSSEDLRHGGSSREALKTDMSAESGRVDNRGESGKTPSTPAETVRDEPIQVMGGLPVVQLRGISDGTYPPRDKSFAMIRHMFHNFGSRFDWFMRADDDLYIRHDKLLEKLQSVDNSVPRYIGQSGVGVPTEKGKLGLVPGRPYCMGGPGVVFSPPALHRLVPHLGECARGTVTSHEDTELGRCVVQHVGIACTNGRLMKKLFYQNYKQDMFMGKLNTDVSMALTLHPFKDPHSMFRLHVHFQLQRLQHLEGKAEHLEKQLNQVNDRLALDPISLTGKSETIQTGESRGKFTFDRHEIVKDFVARTNIVDQMGTVSQFHTKNWVERSSFDSQEESEELRPQQTSQNAAETDMSDDQRVKSHVLDVLKEDNPVWNYAILKKSHVINPFKIQSSNIKIMRNVMNTLPGSDKTNTLNHLRGSQIRAKYQTYSLSHGLQHLITAPHDEGYQSFLLSSRFGPLQWREESEHASWKTVSRNSMDSEKSQSYTTVTSQPLGNRNVSLHLRQSPVTSPWPTLYVLLPLCGRHQTYLTFLKHLASAAQFYPARVFLRVALFPDGKEEHKLSVEASRGTRALDITIIQMQAQFIRAVALNTLSEGFADSAVLIFIDVDLIVTDGFLFRAALNAKPGQAYFPVVFSTFSPLSVCYGRPGNCTVDPFDFSPNSGMWRSFGYGIVAMTAGDVRKAGGFDARIFGWGKEDVNFFNRCVSRGIKISRAPDVGLVHQFHEKLCDPHLPSDQLRMCKSSRNVLIGSSAQLSQMLIDLEV